MKTISYTKMRDELADVLEALRGGEPVTITQRGKADIIISAQIGKSIYPSEQPAWKKSNTENKSGIGYEKIRQKNTNSGKGLGLGLTFEEAKSRTQSKHAGIIKALEDK